MKKKISSLILHTVFGNDADTLNTWQKSKEGRRKERGKERR